MVAVDVQVEVDLDVDLEVDAEMELWTKLLVHEVVLLKISSGVHTHGGRRQQGSRFVH